MAGAPSQVDLLDYKPKLQELDGQHIPESMVKGERFAFIKGVPKLLGSPYQFRKWGKSGAEVSASCAGSKGSTCTYSFSASSRAKSATSGNRAAARAAPCVGDGCSSVRTGRSEGDRLG